MEIAAKLIDAADRLAEAAAGCVFSAPVAYVYNPLVYAWEPHAKYLKRYGATKKKVVFLGMNPGPWGMAQTGVPFGEVNYVRDWLGIEEKVSTPKYQHPKRHVTGFSCPRSEVSGKRLWGLFSHKFGAPEEFFRDHFVSNYCPLMFVEESGRNRTPDKLPVSEREQLFAACDAHLIRMIDVLRPEWIVGIGGFAEKRLGAVAAAGNGAIAGQSVRIGKVLHPSPANPAANRGWEHAAERQLRALGIW